MLLFDCARDDTTGKGTVCTVHCRHVRCQCPFASRASWWSLAPASVGQEGRRLEDGWNLATTLGARRSLAPACTLPCGNSVDDICIMISQTQLDLFTPAQAGWRTSAHWKSKHIRIEGHGVNLFTRKVLDRNIQKGPCEYTYSLSQRIECLGGDLGRTQTPKQEREQSATHHAQT